MTAAGSDPSTAEIDKRVRSLVAALNRIPGVTTFSSCGGHRRPKPGQVPANQFFVDMDITSTRRGWSAITLLAEACNDVGMVDFRPWVNGALLLWNISGYRVPPSLLAERLSDTTPAP